MLRLLGSWRGTEARSGAVVPHDLRAIRDLLERYHRAINFRDWDALGGLFTDDAVWEARAPAQLRFAGRAAIVKGLLQWSVGRHALLVGSDSGLRIDGFGHGRARAESTLLQFGEASGTSAGLRAVAKLSSELVKQGGVWRFKRCSIELNRQGKEPPRA
jgi:ketosteroid isomerase-like protein